MRRRWKILLLAACGLVAVVAVCFFWVGEREPTYNGRTLSQWLQIYKPTVEPVADDRPIDEARTAILQIGTNALPLLVEWVDKHDSQMKVNIADLAYDIPDRLGGTYFVRLLYDRSAERRRELAQAGFEVLGSNAAPCVPQLIAKMNERKDADDARMIAGIVAAMGPAGISALTREAGDERAPYRNIALDQLSKCAHVGNPAIVAAVPALSKIVDNPNDPFRETALQTLVQIQEQPKELIPVFTRALTNGSDFERTLAVSALYRYGTDAMEAVPALQALRATAQNDSLRKAAVVALQRIASDELTNSASKD